MLGRSRRIPLKDLTSQEGSLRLRLVSRRDSFTTFRTILYKSFGHIHSFQYFQYKLKVYSIWFKAPKLCSEQPEETVISFKSLFKTKPALIWLICMDCPSIFVVVLWLWLDFVLSCVVLFYFAWLFYGLLLLVILLGLTWLTLDKCSINIACCYDYILYTYFLEVELCPIISYCWNALYTVPWVNH